MHLPTNSTFFRTLPLEQSPARGKNTPFAHEATQSQRSCRCSCIGIRRRCGRSGLPGKTEASRWKYELAWKVLSSHARKFNGAEESDKLPADGFPFSGMVSFRIRGGVEEANKFLTSTRLFTLAESLGGVENLAEHPAMITHGCISPTERAILGIGDSHLP
jgi:hypothetical protein